MNLITYCRQKMDKSPHRKKMIQFMQKPKHQKICHERSCSVEPMQGIVKDIFGLDRCWMGGEQDNRWLFAAMGLTIQMHQLDAFKRQINLEYQRTGVEINSPTPQLINTFKKFIPTTESSLPNNLLLYFLNNLI